MRREDIEESIMLYLRKATEADCRLLFEWSNDEMVRVNSFHMEPILWDEHKNWYSHMMEDSSEYQYIMMKADEPIGQIRLSVKGKGDVAEIAYSIDCHYRGKGYGKEIIKLAKRLVSSDFPDVSKLVAKVKPSNIASYCCFSKNRFEEKYLLLECEVERKPDFSGGGGEI